MRLSLLMPLALCLAGCTHEPPEAIAKRLGAPDTPADTCKGTIREKAPIAYPKDLQRSRTEGWVMLRVDLDGSGRASTVVVEDSQPRGVFDTAAIEGLKAWRFVEGAKRTDCKIRVMFSIP